MQGEDDVPTLRVEFRPHTQAHLVSFPAKQLRVDRPHESIHAIETFGSRAGRQPFEITVSTRDVTVRAGCDVDDDVSAPRHEYRSPLAKGRKSSDLLPFAEGRRAARRQHRVAPIPPGAQLAVLVEINVVAVDAHGPLGTPAHVAADVKDILSAAAVVGAEAGA